MPNPAIDFDVIVNAIVSCPEVSAAAKEQAAEIVEEWIRTNYESDCEEQTVAVELAFHIQLDKLTFVDGIIDRLSLTNESELVVNEWKTTRPASKWWSEAMWLTELMNSIQLPTYALAVRDGLMIVRGEDKPFRIRGIGERVKVRVRGATKTTPSETWPTGAPRLFCFSDDELSACRAAYLNAAAAIRAFRSSGCVPWHARGRQCFKQWGRDCEFLSECASGVYPPSVHRVYDPVGTDADWAKRFGLEHIPNDPSVVVLSPSSYELYSTCHEKYRRLKAVAEPPVEEKSMALQIGSACHAGWAAYYRMFISGPALAFVQIDGE